MSSRLRRRTGPGAIRAVISSPEGTVFGDHASVPNVMSGFGDRILTTITSDRVRYHHVADVPGIVLKAQKTVQPIRNDRLGEGVVRLLSPCMRGAMADATDTGGNAAIQCQSRRNKMSNVAATTRSGRLSKTTRQACYHDGQCEVGAAHASGRLRTWTDRRFATVANKPSAGYSLYRFSTGHPGTRYEACRSNDLRGAPASQVKMTKSLKCGNKVGNFAAGQAIGCYDCHNGPSGE